MDKIGGSYRHDHDFLLGAAVKTLEYHHSGNWLDR